MLSILLSILFSSSPSIVWTAVPAGGMIAVESAGDVNGDGTDDVFAASVEEEANGIMCLDGLTGDIIWSSNRFPPGAISRDCFRAVPDADLDGITDIAVGLEANNTLVLLSGASGGVLWTAQQSFPLIHLESISGPDPGDAAVIITEFESPAWCAYSARDAADGNQLWSAGPLATSDRWMKTTDGDISGNGWDEVGYSVDRGYVSSGYSVIMDGYSSSTIGGATAMYISTMDITDQSGGILAVSNWGSFPVMWYENILTSDTIWSSDDDAMSFLNLQFVPNGTAYDYPDILGLGYQTMTLIRGNDGYYDGTYSFPGEMTSVECYTDTPIWFAAVSTDDTFYCPELVYSNPSPYPYIDLPGTGSSDMCLLESNLYPTPLAAVSRSGTGPGVCVISTSLPQEVEEKHGSEVSASGIRLLSNPCCGVMSIYAEDDTDLLIVDISGRAVHSAAVEAGHQLYLELPPGLYMIIDRESGLTLHRAMVLPK